MVKETKSKSVRESPFTVFKRTRDQPSPAKPLKNTFGILAMALGNISDAEYSRE